MHGGQLNGFTQAVDFENVHSFHKNDRVVRLFNILIFSLLKIYTK